MGRNSDLDHLLRHMRPVLEAERYVFATLDPGLPVPYGLEARMQFREAEGTTLIVEAGAAAAAGLETSFPCRCLSLTINSSLDAVGFMAAISGALAEDGISCNAVAGYFHDHIFVPEADAERALACLQALSGRHGGEFD